MNFNVLQHNLTLLICMCHKRSLSIIMTYLPTYVRVYHLRALYVRYVIESIMVKEMGQTSLHMLPMAPLAIQYINQLILLLSSPQCQLVLRQFDRFNAKCQSEFNEIFSQLCKSFNKLMVCMYELVHRFYKPLQSFKTLV